MTRKHPPKPRGYPVASTSIKAHAVLEVKAGVFKDTCLQLLDDVRNTNVELIVTKYGEPVARIVATEVETVSAFGFMSGTVLAATDIVAPDFDAWGNALGDAR